MSNSGPEALRPQVLPARSGTNPSSKGGRGGLGTEGDGAPQPQVLPAHKPLAKPATMNRGLGLVPQKRGPPSPRKLRQLIPLFGTSGAPEKCRRGQSLKATLRDYCDWKDADAACTKRALHPRLAAYSAELAASIETLAAHYRSHGLSAELSGTSATGATPRPIPFSTSLNEAYRFRKSILGQLAKIKSLLQDPADFLRDLATQTGETTSIYANHHGKNQVLACLRWLGDFQVLAFIPLEDSVAVRDVADLSGTPETHLTRVIHMMSTVGFLHQPGPGYVAHTTLSIPFVTNPSLLDASLFLSETAAPAALQMSSATQKFGMSDRMDETAYNLALSTPSAFASAYMQRPRLQRQWRAYLRFGAGDVEADLLDTLSLYDWNKLGSATVVETSDQLATCQQGHSTKTNQRITVEQRAPGALQTVLDAAIYIVHLDIASLAAPSTQVPARIVTELRANVGVLRANRQATFLLIMSPVLSSGSVAPDIQATSRLRDLAQWQLANGRGMDTEEFLKLLNGMGDSMGRFVVVDQYSAPNSALGVLEVRFQPHTQRQSEVS
ncbi:hypothetical protein RRF57_009682 [Xylaria bambusicola]|uniref:Uncharacterized protein n=1 Tax=Xylaria bambusicola TaxID=326684 RepID=A0AAN7ZC32_9PEZI